MQRWEESLNEFLKEWKDKPEVIGAVATGSRILGTDTQFSDIDVHIVLSDETEWRERGDKMVNGFLIEYFANPIYQLKKYLEKDHKQYRRSDALMFSFGKIIFDKNGAVKKFQDEAKEWFDKPFEKPDNTLVELSKYTIWDKLDGLKDLENQKSSAFDLCYFLLVEETLRVYSRYLCVEAAPASKLYKYLTDKDFQTKYKIAVFSDAIFVDLLKECLDNKSFPVIEKMATYVLEKMGGFEIDGWKLRTPIER
jgi:hypothetical protein